MEIGPTGLTLTARKMETSLMRLAIRGGNIEMSLMGQLLQC